MFRLAGHLGKSVAWIEENISGKELMQWLAFYEYIEPFGARLIDEQRSVLSIQNYQGKEKAEIKDFHLYDYSTKTPKQRAEEERLKAEAELKLKADAMREFFKRKAAKNT